METPADLITRFYKAFQERDAEGMAACYADNVVFFDPAFELLQANEAKAMWRMLCQNAKDFSLSFGNIQDLGDGYHTCDWVASYTFSGTGRKVVNNVKAHMKIADGKILEHSDGFSLHKWCAQALGLSGKLMGWNSFFQRKLKNKARRNLLRFIEAGN